MNHAISIEVAMPLQNKASPCNKKYLVKVNGNISNSNSDAKSKKY